MNAIDDAKQWATMAIPGAQTPEEAQAQFDAMPMAELASLWCALQAVGLRDQTEGTWAATLYFDRLPHDNPERAFDLVRTVLVTENDRATVMQLNGRLMLSLVNAHGTSLVDRLEAEAQADPRFAWLLGGAYWWTADEALKARLSRVADAAGWRAADEARNASAGAIDVAALSTAELARLWVEQRALPDKDRGGIWHALFDYERDLRESNPDAVLDLVLEVLKIERHPNLLSLLAAGPLEDVVGPATIDRIEREAAVDPAFRELLGGVWYFEENDVKRRLDAIVQGNRW